MTIYKHILFAADLTSQSLPLCQRAVEIAKAHKAKLSIVHVVEPIGAYVGGWYYWGDLAHDLEKQAEDHLATYTKNFNIPEEDLYISTGNTKHVILELAEELKVDLIIVGSHGAKGLSSLLGSTASSILNDAKCDVLTLPYRRYVKK
ncbi:MAG TPA: universal stress protein [Gammaproteobacteria bacterium]|nr:universal stress protein [Gammaproteobacteria bacterium]